MKRWSTTPVSKGLATKSLIVATVVVMAVAGPIAMMPRANADKYDDQIRAIQNEISQYEANASKLNKKANSLQAELNRLEAQKAVIQAQVNLTQAKYEKLEKQIKETQQKIEENKDALGTTIANLYVDGSISPLEMLASSKNIGDYVDKQTYQSSIRDTLTETIATIEKLKKELDEQKVAVKRTLADQKNARDNLAAKEAERQRILSETKGKESNYKQLASKRAAEVEVLKKKQQEEVARRLAQSGGVGFRAVPGSSANGGYPNKWAYAPQNSMVDDWGMFNRQCTSYAAFRVAQAYGNMPYWGGIGNAWEWTRNAENAKPRKIPHGPTPKPGSVGVLQDGGFGHVAWVDSVQSDGTITIDHYNINWSGSYARWTGVSPSFFDDYIYFGEW